jgi:thiol-disulfide isomerase/thioredoxin
MRIQRWWMVIVCLLLLGVPQGRAAQPEIRVVDLKGLEAALAAHKGEAILLNFWAIWCEPCVAELPDLLAVGREFRGRHALVLTVSYDLMIPDATPKDVLKQMQAFVAARKIDAPVYIFNAPDYDAINQRFGLPGPVPMTVAIDASGRVVDRHAGQAGRAGFVAMMKKAIGTQASKTQGSSSESHGSGLKAQGESRAKGHEPSEVGACERFDMD